MGDEEQRAAPVFAVAGCKPGHAAKSRRLACVFETSIFPSGDESRLPILFCHVIWNWQFIVTTALRVSLPLTSLMSSLPPFRYPFPQWHNMNYGSLLGHPVGIDVFSFFCLPFLFSFLFCVFGFRFTAIGVWF